MHFLFRLDLSLHAGAEIFFGILNLVTKHGLRAIDHKPQQSLHLRFRTQGV